MNQILVLRWCIIIIYLLIIIIEGLRLWFLGCYSGPKVLYSFESKNTTDESSKNNTLETRFWWNQFLVILACLIKKKLSLEHDNFTDF